MITKEKRKEKGCQVQHSKKKKKKTTPDGFGHSSWDMHFFFQ